MLVVGLLSSMLITAAAAPQSRDESCYSSDYLRNLTAKCPSPSEVHAARALASEAIYFNDPSEFLVLLWELIDSRPDLDTPEFRALAAAQALVTAQRARRHDLALYLLTAGALPNARLPSPRQTARSPLAPPSKEVHWSLLAFAADAGDRRLVEELLRSGANPNDVDELGETPLIVAAQAMFSFPTRYDDLASILLRLLDAGADPQQEDAGGLSFLGHILFAPTSDQPLLDELLRRGYELRGKGGSRLLFGLAEAGFFDRLRRALELHAHPDLWVDSEGRTALAVVALQSRPGAVAAMSDLVAHGAGVNMQDKRGRTPLFHAVDAGKSFDGRGELSSEVVNTLLSLGADRDHRDTLGRRAADYAAEPIRRLVQ